MLSRHADSLFWLARYVERAENVARVLEAASRLAAMPVGYTGEGNEWEAALVAAGAYDAFKATGAVPDQRNVIEFLSFAPHNPSSIRACFDIARNNARSVRTALTIDMWETINSSWLELKRFHTGRMTRQELNDFLNWVKETSLRFDGSAYRTMLRNDAYYFLRLGSYIERADFTARILDTKAHIFDPSRVPASGSFDYYQWSSILRAVSALTSYHWVYRENLKPHLVADLLILREEMPRSLASCYDNIARFLDSLARDYGRQGPAQRRARATLGRLQGTDMSGIFQVGLHEFLSEFIWDNSRLGNAIAEQYLV